MCAHVCKGNRVCVCGCADSSACLLVKKDCRKTCGDTRGLLIGSSTSCTEEKSIHIPEAHNGACRGSGGVAEKCQSRYTVQLRGHYVTDGQHSTGRATDLYISWLAYSPPACIYSDPSSMPALFFCSAYCKSTHKPWLSFAGRLNVKIKVNGIRVNKTTGCLGNSAPCPTHSSLYFCPITGEQ